MLLNDLLQGITNIEIHGDINININALSIASNDTMTAQTAFVAIQGTNIDAHIFINDALTKGASVAICSTLPNELLPQKTYIKISDTSHTLGVMAHNLYEKPSEKIQLIGITGTNGKTTTATVLFELFRKLGYSVGLISTVANRIDNATITATHTTPDAINLNKLLLNMVHSGCQYVFMEVSSHAVVQQRIAGLKFAGGVFTNITHDHLDFHKTFAEYIKAKKMFFDNLPKAAFALTNTDDKNGGVMLQNTQAQKYNFALKTAADFKGKIIENDFDGLLMHINGTDFHSPLVGGFNAYNLLAAYSTAILLHQNNTEILQQLSTIQNVAGRFDCITSKSTSKNHRIGIIDYAHTPDALENVLTTIQIINQNHRQIITIIGCGGNRDATKRPEMARIACKYSHKTILTTDNPRYENPDDILADMQKGVPLQHQYKTLTIPDRTQAIKTACMMAQHGDIILLAGKGHENYQDIMGIKHPFDDKKILMELLNT